MFTGIVTHIGEVITCAEGRLQVRVTEDVSSYFSHGESIAVDGACLTITDFDKSSFSIEYMPETAKKTTIGAYGPGTKVNLEMPLQANARISGHFVQGHIDTTTTIMDIVNDGNSRIFSFKMPQMYRKYIVHKGSIAINGISLTVIEATEEFFTVGIIPTTIEKTMLSESKIGDIVNIEVDILAKYTENILSHS